jgi:hypothetical protein
MKRFFVFVSCIYLWLASIHAGELKRLREADAKATPCGFYVTSLANDSSGVMVAEPNSESVRKHFASNPDLKPKLVYFDRNSGKPYKTAEELKKAIAEGTAMPFMDHPQYVWVGLSKWGEEKDELVNLTEEQLEEKAPGTNIKVKDLWRPNREMSTLPAYVYQQIHYLFPSIGLDYQKPLPTKKSTTY